MASKDLTIIGRYWCWWLHRFLYYKGKYKTRGTMIYQFKDITDEPFSLKEEDVEKLL